MPKITPQRVLDAAREAFIVNDRPPSYDVANDVCAYQQDDRRCAVGLLIPDGHEALDAVADVQQLRNEWPELFYRFTDINKVSALQDELHDKIQRYGEWSMPKEERDMHYEYVAKKHGLKYKRVYGD